MKHGPAKHTFKFINMKKDRWQEINEWMEEQGWVETQDGRYVTKDNTKWAFGHGLEDVQEEQPAPTQKVGGGYQFSFWPKKVPVQYYFFDDTNDALMFKLAWGGKQ